MRFNPFRPNNPVVPGMFVGRGKELDAIEQSLLQAKNGNPLHFLVHGERGIGKTSLLDYVKDLANGEFATPDQQMFKFLTVFIDFSGCRSNLDIVKSLGRGLRLELNKHDDLLKNASEFWDWITNWEILGIKYNKPVSIENIDVEEIMDEFISRVSKFLFQSTGSIDGILLLIDEADAPPLEAELGRIIKFTCERLARERCYNVLFGLAGLPTLLAKLRESHESSPRLFHIMLLEPLEFNERKKVVNLGLEKANNVNSEVTAVEEDALDFLAELSEGYPHFVQQFAYSAFEYDSDEIIDFDDVVYGAFDENGALSQLGDKFFSQMYNARISSEDYRRVLDSMAEHGDGWVARKTIIKESGVSETSVTNALKALRDREIVISDEARRGFYRLPTKSFAVWINAIKAAASKKDAERAM